MFIPNTFNALRQTVLSDRDCRVVVVFCCCFFVVVVCVFFVCVFVCVFIYLFFGGGRFRVSSLLIFGTFLTAALHKKSSFDKSNNFNNETDGFPLVWVIYVQCIR